MKAADHRIGRRFSSLTVIAMSEQRTSDGKSKCVCRCECGNESVVPWKKLRQGRIKSCGCRSYRPAVEPRSKHPLFGTWSSMHSRCSLPTNVNFPSYGGRGIRVCDRWHGESGFTAFCEDMGPKPSPEHTLDRIDNDGPYSPENCRWATSVEQMRNRRFNRIVEYGGKRLCISAWSSEIGLPARILSSRLRRGWTLDRAFTEPLNPPNGHRP